MPALTPMVKRILIANVVIWVLQSLSRSEPAPLGAADRVDLFAVSVSGVFEHGYIWQPFTYMWLHDPHSPLHLLLNMFMLYMFGTHLEAVWGGRRLLRFYLATGIGAGVFILVWQLIVGASAVATLGASGAIFGLLTAFALLWPDRTLVLIPIPIPVKAIYLIPIMFVATALFGPENISHAGHLGGVIMAAILLRDDFNRAVGVRSLRYRWHRYRMRGRLRAVRREEWERRRQRDDDEPRPPTYH